jgi:hypothetical protein
MSVNEATFEEQILPLQLHGIHIDDKSGNLIAFDPDNGLWISLEDEIDCDRCKEKGCAGWTHFVNGSPVEKVCSSCSFEDI